MAHDLEITEGAARFAYAGEVPWHRLGTRMDGQQTAEAMLIAANADFTVSTQRVIACDDEGNPLTNTIITPNGVTTEYVYVDDSRATVRTDTDGSYKGLATVGTRYTPAQNIEVMNRAMDIIAAQGLAIVETVGVLAGGKRFFSAIDLGSLVIDPAGANDQIGRYLLVYNSHDGKVPVTYANTNVRAVCANTVRMALNGARSTFKARHTKKGGDFANEEARKVLAFSLEFADQFGKMALEMMKIDVPVGSFKVDKVLNALWTPDPAATDRQRANRDTIVGTVRSLFVNDKNVGKVGPNGWALYNAVVEYVDHKRPVDSADDRAVMSMDEVSAWSKLKLDAQAAVLALA